MICDVGTLHGSCMTFDDVTSLVDLLIVNQLESWLMLKIFWKCFQLKVDFNCSLNL